MELPIDITQPSIKSFCERWKVNELAAFGSVLRKDFHDTSDVDLLISFEPDASVSLFDMVRMKTELETIFARKVDLISKKGIENSRNPIRKNAILKSMQVIYGT